MGPCVVLVDPRKVFILTVSSGDLDVLDSECVGIKFYRGVVATCDKTCLVHKNYQELTDQLMNRSDGPLSTDGIE